MKCFSCKKPITKHQKTYTDVWDRVYHFNCYKKDVLGEEIDNNPFKVLSQALLEINWFKDSMKFAGYDL